MKHIHVIYAQFDKKQVSILAEHGIKVEAKYDRFDIEENDQYFALKPYLDQWKVNDYVVTRFSEADLQQAKRLVLLSPWANGYPMPDDDNGYLHTTYNNEAFCSGCGIGLHQKDAFRLKKAPAWSSHKQMFSLNWVFDELFVTQSLYDGVFKPLGVQSGKVLLFKKELELQDTLQLVIPEISTPLSLDGYASEKCKDCNEVRYELINKGFFPPFQSAIEDRPVFKSREWFGTGANARKYIFVSQSVRQELIERKVNANYIACA